MRKIMVFALKSSAFTLVAALLGGLAGPAAQADVRWYNPAYDGVGTLRICYKVTQMKSLGDAGFEFQLEYSGDDAGTDKLNRKSYPSIQDVELETRGRVVSATDPVHYAFQNNVYACEISWEYGLHWVVSRDEISGDR
jgi:hypothetical protein